jgi:hypothetical protein
MEALTELQALQNAARDLNLTIHEKSTQDKRKTVKLYFANRGNETLSPNLDYENMNHFLLGWRKSNKYKSKPEKAANSLLKALKRLLNVNPHAINITEKIQAQAEAIEAINKAIN